tara:strand:+ start:295 stop:582 length:288 start_codon:yes stop_codon:yes gene_type:complete
MNNLQFIATYIFENPGKTRYNEIIRNLMLWKGFRAEEIVCIGGQYSRYFTKIHSPYSSNRYEYHGDLWVKIDPKNRQSGYKLTEKGMSYVNKGGK